MSGSYYLVENSKGKTGYIAKEALSKTVTTTTAYTKKPVNVYKSASTSSVLTTLSVNAKVSVIGSSGSWSKVKTSSGSVPTRPVRFTSARPRPRPNGARRP